MGNTVVLDRFEIAHTHNPETMRQALMSIGSADSLEVPRSRDAFEARANYSKLISTSLGYYECSTPSLLRNPEGSDLRLYVILSGALSVKFGRTQLDMTNHQSGVIPEHAKFQTKCPGVLRFITLRINANSLGMKLGGLIGADPRPLEFDPVVEFANPNSERIRRMTHVLVSEIDACPTSLPTLVTSELEQALMVCFLLGVRHNYSQMLDSESSRVAPWQVRRVKDYIEAHYTQPITIEALATAAGASARSIFRSFRQCHGCSPMEFVKRIRLERARGILAAANAGHTVTSVALACGFHSLGHFARAYRDQFGELPSETLRKSSR